MKMPFRLAVLCATLSLAGSAAFAQAQSSQNEQSSSEKQSSSEQKKAPVQFNKSSTLGGQRGLAMDPDQKQVLFVASELIGKKVSTAQGQNLGKLSEIIFGPQQGVFAVVDLGNQKQTALPWQLVIAVTGDDLVVNTTPSALNGGPTLDKSKNYESFNDPQFTKKLFSYFGVQQQGMGSGGSSAQGSGGEQSESSQKEQSSQEQQEKKE